VTGRLLAAAVGLLLLGALLVRGSGRGAAWAPFPPPPQARRAAPRSTVPRPPATAAVPSRNLFQYADGNTPSPTPASPIAPRGPQEPITPVATPTPPGVRVAGLVRSGGQLKAALVVQGELTLAGKGERAGGYTVLDVDEESGVRVRGPGGEETVLPPPRF
jgi:hypothetical protein